MATPTLKGLSLEEMPPELQIPGPLLQHKGSDAEEAASATRMFQQPLVRVNGLTQKSATMIQRDFKVEDRLGALATMVCSNGELLNKLIERHVAKSQFTSFIYAMSEKLESVPPDTFTAEFRGDNQLRARTEGTVSKEDSSESLRGRAARRRRSKSPGGGLMEKRRSSSKDGASKDELQLSIDTDVAKSPRDRRRSSTSPDKPKRKSRMREQLMGSRHFTSSTLSVGHLSDLTDPHEVEAKEHSIAFGDAREAANSAEGQRRKETRALRNSLKTGFHGSRKQVHQMALQLAAPVQVAGCTLTKFKNENARISKFLCKDDGKTLHSGFLAKLVGTKHKVSREVANGVVARPELESITDRVSDKLFSTPEDRAEILSKMVSLAVGAREARIAEAKGREFDPLISLADVQLAVNAVRG